MHALQYEKLVFVTGGVTMYDSAILELAIGLIFVFSVLSILVTHLNSFLGTLLKWRSRHLVDAFEGLIEDPELRAKLLTHPLVNLVKPTTPPQAGLSAQAAASINQADEVNPPGGGATIPWWNLLARYRALAMHTRQLTGVNNVAPDTFSESFIGTMIAAAGTALYLPLQTAVEALPASSSQPEHDFKERLRALNLALQNSFSHVTLDAIRAEIAAAPPEYKDALETALAATDLIYKDVCYDVEAMVPLLAGVKKINNEAFRQAMESILVTARDIDEARVKIKNWYDNVMWRATQHYKEKIALVSFWIALVMAVTLNVDSLHIGRVLWEDQDLRLTVAQVARDSVLAGEVAGQAMTTPDLGAQSAEPDPTATPDPNAEPAPIPFDAPSEAPTTQELLTETLQDADAISETLERLISLNLPIGWTNNPISAESVQAAEALAQQNPYTDPRNLANLWPLGNPYWGSLVLAKLAGWLITAVAAAQGAPFWFDLLNKIARGK